MADPTQPPAGPPDELSPLDYLLHRGEAHPATRSAFLNLEILDRPADWGQLREAIDRASRVVIRMRQKVVVPPLPTTPPRWVVDPDFDLDYHLRRVALPAPGSLRQLLDAAELTLQSPLDTSRALWEAVYVEGLEGGRAALLIKLSHAITDGLGGIALFEQVYDTEREAPPRPMPPVPVPRDLSGNDLLRASLRELPETTLSAPGGRCSAVLRPRSGAWSRDRVRRSSEAIGFAGSALRVLGPPPAEPSPLLRRRSLVSRTFVLELPLADLRAAAKAVIPGSRPPRGSVGQRRLSRGAVRRPGPVPRDARRAGRGPAAGDPGQPAHRRRPGRGNRFTGVSIAAPMSEPDPAARILQIRAQVIVRRS